MGGVGWALAVLYQLFVFLVSRRNPQTPRGTPLGYVSAGILLICAVLLLYQSLRRGRPPVRGFQRSSVMDFLAFGSVVVFVALGTFLVFGPTIVTSQPLNALAVRLENVWVFVCGIVFFAYRLWKGADVTV